VANAELIPQWAVGFTDWLDVGVLCNKVRRARDDTANGTQVREKRAQNSFLNYKFNQAEGGARW